MDANQDIGICGTWVKTIEGSGGTVWKYPTDSDTIKCSLFFVSVLAHPSVMMRRSMINEHNLRYDINYPYSVDDFQLWQHYTNR